MGFSIPLTTATSEQNENSYCRLPLQACHYRSYCSLEAVCGVMADRRPGNGVLFFYLLLDVLHSVYILYCMI